MTKEHGRLCAFAPEADGVRQSGHGGRMTSDKASAKVDAIQPMLLSVHVSAPIHQRCEQNRTKEGFDVRYLTNVVRHSVQQAATDVFRLPVALDLAFPKDLAEGACNSGGLEADLAVIGSVCTSLVNTMLRRSAGVNSQMSPTSMSTVELSPFSLSSSISANTREHSD